jgi:hypothetical protein
MNDRARWLRRLAPAALVVALAVAWLLPTPAWVTLATPDPDAADRLGSVLDALPQSPRMLVGFDPDVGTYAEVRPTVRALLDELIDRGAHLDVVSVTAEGRALATAELARLGRAGSAAGQVGDLGFVAGAEAALVQLAATVPSRYHAILVVGGNDVGPRSWVEQVLPRAAGIPLVAITPSVLLPEVQPYLASAQLDAALVTPREGAAFRAALEGDGDADAPSGLAVLIGMLVAILVLAQGVASRTVAELRSVRAAREAE